MSRLHAPATYSILEMKILQVVTRDSIVPHCGWIQPKLLPACKVLNNGPPHFWHFELNVLSMICSCVYAGSYKNKILLAHLYNLLPCVHVYCDYFLKCCQIYQNKKIFIKCMKMWPRMEKGTICRISSNLRLLLQYTVNYNTQRFFWCSYFFDFSDMYSTTNGFIHLAHQLQFRENRC